jgi:hypothetical protein
MNYLALRPTFSAVLQMVVISLVGVPHEPFETVDTCLPPLFHSATQPLLFRLTESMKAHWGFGPELFRLRCRSRVRS